MVNVPQESGLGLSQSLPVTMLARSGIPVIRTLLVRIYPFSFLTMSNDNLEQEVPATPESETVEVPVDTDAKIPSEGMNA